jgi:hypothetical protein
MILVAGDVAAYKFHLALNCGENWKNIIHLAGLCVTQYALLNNGEQQTRCGLVPVRRSSLYIVSM